MAYYDTVRDVGQSTDRRRHMEWTGGSVRRFSIAAALTLANHFGKLLKWRMQWAPEPLYFQGASGAGDGLIGNATERSGEPVDGWVSLPTDRPTAALLATGRAEAFYFGGVLDYAREAGHDVGEDPLAWSRRAGLDA